MVRRTHPTVARFTHADPNCRDSPRRRPLGYALETDHFDARVESIQPRLDEQSADRLVLVDSLDSLPQKMGNRKDFDVR